MDRSLKHIATTSHVDKAYLFNAALKERGIHTHVDESVANQPVLFQSNVTVRIYVHPDGYQEALSLLKDSEEFADIAEGNVKPIQMQTDAWSGLWQPLCRLAALACAAFLIWHYFMKWFSPGN